MDSNSQNNNKYQFYISNSRFAANKDTKDLVMLCSCGIHSYILKNLFETNTPLKFYIQTLNGEDISTEEKFNSEEHLIFCPRKHPEPENMLTNIKIKHTIKTVISLSRLGNVQVIIKYLDEVNKSFL